MDTLCRYYAQIMFSLCIYYAAIMHLLCILCISNANIMHTLCTIYAYVMHNLCMNYLCAKPSRRNDKADYAHTARAPASPLQEGEVWSIAPYAA